MTWSKLSDDFFTHPKVVRAGRDARDLYLVGLCHCNEFLTDGLIEQGYLRQLGAKADIDDAKTAATALVAVGLWEMDQGGFRVHHFLDHNLSREQHGKNAEDAKRRKREWLERNKQSTPSERQTGLEEEQRSEHQEEQRSEHPLPVSRIPYPESCNPTPDTPPKPPTSRAGPPGGAGIACELEVLDKNLLNGFAEIWDCYPNHANKGQAQTAYAALSPSAVLRAQILDGIARAKQTDQWRRGVIPHLATWLKGRRWADELMPAGQSPPPARAAPITGTTATVMTLAGRLDRTRGNR